MEKRMGVSTQTVNNSGESVVEDVKDDTLAILKAKMAKTQEKQEKDMTIQIVDKKKRSIDFGVIGSGQAGSRLAECFAKHGYSAVAINTAQQDLEHIDLPQDSKLLLEYGLGGAAKDLSIGKEAAETNRDAINELVHEKLGSCQAFMFCLSLGGGSGAGSCETIIDILSEFGKPILVMTVVPMSSDDAQTKKNALETLAKLAKLTQTNVIHNLIVVDNAKIEAIYSDVSLLNFFDVSNNAIVSPIHSFNTLTSMGSSIKPLDPMEFAKIMTDGQGLTVYGEMTVKDYEVDTAIADAVISNLTGGLLSNGFDLKQSKYVGFIVEANAKVYDKIPNKAVDYAMSMVGELCSAPNGVFKGIYMTDMKEDAVKVYSIFSGLGLPDARVSQLKKEAAELELKAKDKNVQRNLALNLDTGTEESVSLADQVRKNIAAKKSAFGSMLKASVVDRRK